MPWCEPCGKFYSPNTLNPDGTCPEHHPVGDPSKQPRQAADGAAESSEESARVPWHFWLLAIGVLIYLGWRLVQLVLWIF